MIFLVPKVRYVSVFLANIYLLLDVTCTLPFQTWKIGMHRSAANNIHQFLRHGRPSSLRVFGANHQEGRPGWKHERLHEKLQSAIMDTSRRLVAFSFLTQISVDIFFCLGSTEATFLFYRLVYDFHRLLSGFIIIQKEASSIFNMVFHQLPGFVGGKMGTKPMCFWGERHQN